MFTLTNIGLLTRKTKPSVSKAGKRRKLVAASMSLALLLAAGVAPTAAQTRDNPSACVNGYRTTHVVISRGRERPGVLLRCKDTTHSRQRARRGYRQAPAR